MGGRPLLQGWGEDLCGAELELSAARFVVQVQSGDFCRIGGTGGDRAGAICGAVQVGFGRGIGGLALVRAEGVAADILRDGGGKSGDWEGCREKEISRARKKAK